MHADEAIVDLVYDPVVADPYLAAPTQGASEGFAVRWLRLDLQRFQPTDRLLVRCRRASLQLFEIALSPTMKPDDKSQSSFSAWLREELVQTN